MPDIKKDKTFTFDFDIFAFVFFLGINCFNLLFYLNEHLGSNPDVFIALTGKQTVYLFRNHFVCF